MGALRRYNAQTQEWEFVSEGYAQEWPPSVSMAEVAHLANVTGDIQEQLDNKEPADADIAKRDVQQAWTKPQRPSLSAEVTPSSGVATWDLTSDQVFPINLTSSITTFNLTGSLADLVGYQYQCVVRFNGGSAITWNANMKFEGGTPPTLTGVSGKLDILNFTVCYNGTSYYLSFTGMAQNL